ncbi:MAG: penicillin-binding protein 2 [Actinomycetia bacterium]|nr:penicillin-binding protein 2 [Actinomycetes bacterium]
MENIPGPAPRSIARRLALMGGLLVIAWLAMAFKMYTVQVVDDESHAERGLRQRLSIREVLPERGEIFDRNGEALALTVLGASLFAIPSEIQDPVLVAQQVGLRVGADIEKLTRDLQSGEDFVYIKRQLEVDMVEEIMNMGFAGVYSEPESKRIYPSSVASHVLGMVNIDGVGIEGLEYYYQEDLAGEPGRAMIEQDVKGRQIPTGLREITEAVRGSDLITTVDLLLQYSLMEACRSGVARTGAEQCWAVALHPETGEILAMGGVPSFDPDERVSEDGSPFANFAVRGMYEPGSTQKAVTIAAALDTGFWRASDLIPQVPYEIEIFPRACEEPDDDIYGCYRDFTYHDPLDLTVADIFVRSSNVGTIMVQQSLPRGVLSDYIHAFGLGTRTGVDFSGEPEGLVNLDPSCSTCLASAAIGYSVAVTPIQMASAFGAIANDGVWVQPHLVRALRVDGEVRPVADIEQRRVISPETARIMRYLMADTVNKGTGQAAAVTGFEVGGKTGTSSKLGFDGYDEELNIASFIGLAPIDDPKVVVMVVVDGPTRSEFRTGGSAAAPVFSEIMEVALRRFGEIPNGNS